MHSHLAARRGRLLAAAALIALAVVAVAPVLASTPAPVTPGAVVVPVGRAAAPPAPEPVVGDVLHDRLVPASVAVARVGRPSSTVPAAPVGSVVRGSSGGSRAVAGASALRNHLRMPSLGISRGTTFFPCSRSQPPGHLVYRWGCAGRNNVYLFAHASSRFRALHDAYVAGRLRKGMTATFTDSRGRARTYRVAFWRVVRPDGDIAWAFAAQSRPSLTLQTCVGADNSHRLVVRLVADG